MTERADAVKPAQAVITKGVRYRASSRWTPLLVLAVAVPLLVVAPPFGVVLLVFAGIVLAMVVRLERYQRAERASRAALALPPGPERVTLVPVATETRWGRVRIKFVLRDASGADRAMAWIVPDRERFEPHGDYLVHGAPEPGQAVALDSASRPTTLVPLGRLEPVPADPSGATAARTRILVELLGWDQDGDQDGGRGQAAGAPVVRTGTRVTPDQLGGGAAGARSPQVAASVEASIARSEAVRARENLLLLPAAVVFVAGVVLRLPPWWLGVVAAAWWGSGRVARRWQVQPVGREVARSYGVSNREGAKLALAFLGLHGAEAAPQA